MIEGLPTVTQLIFDTLRKAHEAEDAAFKERHKGKPVTGFASEALQCDRKIALRMLDIDETNSIPASGRLAFWMGVQLHDYIERVVAPAYPNAEPEYAWTLDGISGRADMRYDTKPTGGDGVIMEVKSMVPYPWELAVTGKYRNPAQGPKPGDMLQAQLSCYAAGAKWIHIVYVNKAGKYGVMPVAEWVLPYDRSLVELELKRVQGILATVKGDHVPGRYFPEETRLITDPVNENWPCGYCKFQVLCSSLNAGDVPTEDVNLVRGAIAKEETERNAS